MAKSKLQKNKDLEELTQKLKTAKGVVFSDYRGTTVKDMDKLRRKLRAENIFVKVYKISLLKKALETSGIKAEGLDFKTPIIVAGSMEDETTAARVIKNLSKELKTIQILEGIADGKLVGKQAVLALADLPSKQQLRGRLVGAINAPVRGFVNVLVGNLRGLMNVLNKVAGK